MKTQKEIFGAGSLKNLREVLTNSGSKKIFLVTGKKSFEKSGAEKYFQEELGEFEFVRCNEFSENPKIEDVKSGMEKLRKANCGLVLAVGGGSVIDIAKLVNIFSHQPDEPESYIEGKSEITERGKVLIAVPTTSGAGSEATQFAVVYRDKEKFSVLSENILPDKVIIDPELTYSLPPEVTATSGMDALSQAVESYWSVNSTEESKEYSTEAINLILQNIDSAVNSPSSESRAGMSKGANKAGKAINITKTTAPHAISYSMTSYFGVTHGQAVSLTLGEFFVYNYEITENENNDKRGIKYVKDNIEELVKLFECKNVYEVKLKLDRLMKRLNLRTRLSETGIKSENDINIILDNVNTERLRNNPRLLSKKNLNTILRNVL